MNIANSNKVDINKKKNPKTIMEGMGKKVVLIQKPVRPFIYLFYFIYMYGI